VPSDVSQHLTYYTHHGYRVLALAGKQINIHSGSVSSLKRVEAESDLSFLGFIIFENKLKEETSPVIHALKNANIRQVMCTGDNLLTSISVSRACGLVDESRTIYVPRFVRGQAHEEDSEIECEDVDQSGQKLDPQTFMVKMRILYQPINPRNLYPPRHYDLAITGDVFNWMIDFTPDHIFEKAFESLIYRCYSNVRYIHECLQIRNIS
jgi:cation-transporting ATPase 13A3/4/5